MQVNTSPMREKKTVELLNHSLNAPKVYYYKDNLKITFNLSDLKSQIWRRKWFLIYAFSGFINIKCCMQQRDILKTVSLKLTFKYFKLAQRNKITIFLEKCFFMQMLFSILLWSVQRQCKTNIYLDRSGFWVFNLSFRRVLVGIFKTICVVWILNDKNQFKLSQLKLRA